MGFKKGDRVRYLGTKKGMTDNNWEEYFGRYGIKKGSEGDISNYYNKNSIFVCEDGRDTTNGELGEEDLELVESKPTKFEIGDTVEMIEDYSYAKIGMIGIIRSKIRGISNQCQVEFEKEFKGGHSCNGSIENNRGHNLSFKSIKLVSKEKLIKKKMELDVKKIDKSILAEANKEVLTEIANEQKEIAKKKLRELYDRKKVAENNAKEVSDELKEITKDLKDLVKSK